ncbi:hypothetical protein StoSoilB22_18300 [Arthrobacter sp. StoSoilB22]|nr:hypothetical protein StoSoilB22_18300 [Arthrobacter sp. StoSoilB22]
MTHPPITVNRTASPKRTAECRQVPAVQWNELRAGDRVWVYDATWGTGIGRIDDISHDQELLGSSSSRPCAD